MPLSITRKLDNKVSGSPLTGGSLRRLLALLRERFPLTAQGLAVLLIALAALRVFGYGRMDLVVFALAVCALAIVCFSTVFVLLGGLILRHQIREHLEMQVLLEHTPAVAVVAHRKQDIQVAVETLA